MKNSNPKGPTPSLIGSSNGRPKRIIVERKSKCCRCCNDIQVGQDCFGIPKVGSGFTSVRRFCKECFEKVLIQTYKDLEKVKNL